MHLEIGSGGLESTCRASETGTEFFDAAGFNDASLSARVEGVRFRGYVALEKRVAFAIDLGVLTSLDRGADNEFVARLNIKEHNFAILGVKAFFHDFS